MICETKESPVLFNGPMVRAILDGSKTQTRRVLGLPCFKRSDTPGYDWTWRGQAPIKSVSQQMRHPQGCWQDVRHDFLMGLCPLGQPGDRLWVRENCSAGESEQGHPGVYYPATRNWVWGLGHENNWSAWNKLHEYGGGDDCGRTVPSIHMPRWASRILLEVTDVRVERVQEISREDAAAEGVKWNQGPLRFGHTNSISAFHELWDSIAKPGERWADNPWVWAVTFNRIGGAQ